jgi:hypothetical protein
MISPPNRHPLPPLWSLPGPIRTWIFRENKFKWGTAPRGTHKKIFENVTFVVAYLPHLGYPCGAKFISTHKELNPMVFNSLYIRTIFTGAVLAVSASYAVASTLPIAPFPPIPTGSIAAASALPIAPFPPIPTGSKAVASALPIAPFPPIPTGSKAVASALPIAPFPPIPTGSKAVASALPIAPFPPIPTGSKALSA